MAKKSKKTTLIVDFSKQRTAPQDDYIDEAVRYFQNARKIIRENCTIDETNRYYTDKKYVRQAGNTLWLGCLEALEGFFKLNTNIKNHRVDIKEYKEAARGYKNLLNYLNYSYMELHLYMGYDGNCNVNSIKDYFENAKYLINEVQVQRLIKEK